jgi:hypothetical protein
VNEVSFRARPHHNVHSTLGVDTGATDPRRRADSIEGGGGPGIHYIKASVSWWFWGSYLNGNKQCSCPFSPYID